jgi:predicted RNA-binding protein associated with RNAse of E/G family
VSIPSTEAQRLRQLAARLVHDVAKYVSRTARNLTSQALSPDLVAMLCRDLFALPRGRASAVFAELARPLEQTLGLRPELERARSLLADIDALEAAVRDGQPAALQRAAQAALAVEAILRDFACNLEEQTP